MNNRDKLFKLALMAKNKAYSPYSNFQVGAAILSSNNNFYSGCNVENASYPEGSCAETGAIAQMVAGGDTLIKEILIIGDDETTTPPCGGCRQRIAEFSDKNTLVHLADIEGIKETFTIEELLPHSFLLKE